MEWSNTIMNEWCLMKIDKRIMLEIKIGSRVGSSYIHKYTHMHANTHTYIYIYIYIFLDETSDCMIMPRVERIYEMAGRKEAGSVILANNHIN
jgi:hypothetical protein